MTSPLTQHATHLLKAYSNFPRGQYVSLVIVRKTESETLFRTEGAGEDLSKEFVRAGAQDDEIIQRALMTKRKQTAVERRTGRELLREHKRLYSKNEKSGECALNRNNACERCIDCMLYGYAVGGGGAQKSRVMTEDAFSILKTGVVTAKRTGNALYDNSTMRDPETGEPSQAIFTEPYIKPETHFLEVETLKDVTVGEWVYVLGNVLRSTRYGAVSSRQGRIKNTLVGVVFSDCEIFSNLELTQCVYDLLKAKDAELNFPLRDTDVEEAVTQATGELMKRVASKQPQVLSATVAGRIKASVVKVYRSSAHVNALLAATEKGYSPDRAAAESAHDEVMRLLEELRMSHEAEPSPAHIYRCELTLWEHTFFSSREIGAFFQTEPVIGNYALAYALGLAQSPYHATIDEATGKQSVTYARDLAPLNARGVYVTPATIRGEPKFALTQFNAQTDTFWSAFAQNAIVSRQDHEQLQYNGQNWQQLDPSTGKWKKSSQAKPVNYPQHGRIKMLALGNRAVSYVISREPLDTLPSYVRLGKFMSKAAVAITHLVSQAQERIDLAVEQFLNPTDLPNADALRVFDLLSIHPTPLIHHAQLSGWFYRASDGAWLPAGMRFGIEGLS